MSSKGSSKAKLNKSGIPKPCPQSGAKSKVRRPPDFSKLHAQWTDRLEKGKACTKKPCTVVQEFGLSQTGERVSRVSGRTINTPQRYQAGGDTPLRTPASVHKAGFEVDESSLDSIVNRQGLPASSVTGRATIATATCVGQSKAKKTRKSTSSTKPKRNKPAVQNTSIDNEKPQDPAVPPSGSLLDHTENMNVMAAEQQLEGCLDFALDAQAMQSILENTGISVDKLLPSTAPTSKRLTQVKECTTPVSRAAKVECTQSELRVMRPSIYMTGRPVDTHTCEAVCTDFKNRFLSRLTMDRVNAAVTKTCSAASPVTRARAADMKSVASPLLSSTVVNQRQSIYTRIIRPCMAPKPDAVEEQPSAKKPPSSVSRAKRVLLDAAPSITTASRTPQQSLPEKSPVTGRPSIYRSASKNLQPKWKNLLGPKSPRPSDKDSLAKSLEFGDEAEDLEKLKAIEEQEKRLQRDIHTIERQKQTKTQPSHTQDVGPKPLTADQLHKLQVLEAEETAVKEEIQRLEEKKSKPQPNKGPSQKRAPLMALPDNEVRQRSLAFDNEDSDSDSFFIIPDSPVVSSESSAGTPTKQVQNGTEPRQMSPLCIADLKGNRTPEDRTPKKASPMTPNSQKGKKKLTPRKAQLRALSPHIQWEGQRSPKVKGMGSPLLSKVLCKAALSPMEQDAYFTTEFELDKENMSPSMFAPRSPLPFKEKDLERFSPSRKKFGKLAGDLMDSVSELEKLDSEMLGHQDNINQLSGDAPSDQIMQKLQLIKQKQDKLMQIQKSLQKKLKGSSPRTPEDRGSRNQHRLSSAKKRLQMTDDAKKEEPRVSPTSSDQEELARPCSPDSDESSQSKPRKNLKSPDTVQEIPVKQKTVRFHDSQLVEVKEIHRTENILKSFTKESKADGSEEHPVNMTSLSKVSGNSVLQAKLAISGEGDHEKQDNVGKASPKPAKTKRERRRSAFSTVETIEHNKHKSPDSCVNVQNPSCLTPTYPTRVSGLSHPMQAYSPKPRLAGSAQFFGSPYEMPAPINTPLALRNAALRGQRAQQVSTNIPTQSAEGDSIQVTGSEYPGDTQMSPLDLSSKSVTSISATSSRDNSAFSPDITFSYLKEESPTNSEPATEFISSPKMLNNSTQGSENVSPSFHTPSRPASERIAKGIDAEQLTPSHKVTGSKQTASAFGPLSLAANVSVSQLRSLPSPVHSPCVAPPTAVTDHLRQCLFKQTAQRYYDALLDEEVALYACRLQSRDTHSLSEIRCPDPVAFMLEHGDDMHFVPIHDEQFGLSTSPGVGTGSAFMRCM